MSKKWLKIREAAGKHRSLSYYICYTLLFVLLSAFLLRLFQKAGRIPMKASDGFPQDYNAFLYWGNYLRRAVRILFTERRLSLPHFDPTIGYGADLVLTLHYHVVGDPFYLILLLIPVRFLDTAYGLLALLRMYLSGITFSLFARYPKGGEDGLPENRDYAVLPGALLYALSGYQLRVGFTNNMFAMPTIWFPLVILGAERVFRKKKPGLFIWAAALSALSNFYFFYMIAAFTVLYCIFRYCVLVKSYTVKDLGSWIGRFLLYGINAMMIAAVVFLPVALHLMLYMNRFGVERYSTLLYPLHYYKLLPSVFMTMDAFPGMYTYLGMTAAGALAVFLLFTARKRYTDLKIAFCLLSLFILVPFFGRALNGFAYMTNRWTWAFTLLISYIVVKMVPEICSLSASRCLAVFFADCLLMILLLRYREFRTEQIFMALLLLLLLSLFLSSVSEGAGRAAELFRQASPAVFLLIAMAGICCNMYYRYSKNVSEEIFSYRKYGTVEQSEFENGLVAVKELEDPGLYRTEPFHMSDTANTAMNNGMLSTGFYYSIYNNYISTLFREVEMLTTSYDYRYYDLDGRSMLEALLGVKYAVANEGEEGYFSRSFREEPERKASSRFPWFTVRENENSLPLAFAYDRVLDSSAYENMDAAGRQQALLQGAYTPDTELSLPLAEPERTDHEMACTLVPEEGVEIAEGAFHVKEDGTALLIRYEGVPESENYVEIRGLDYREESESDDKTSVRLILSGIGPEKSYQYRNYRHLTYCGQHDFLYNAGYSPEAVKELKLTFDTAGTYTFDEMKVICQETDRLNDYVNHLKETTLDGMEFGDDRITGSVTLDREKLLCVTVPYSTGWSVLVDGEKREVIRTDTSFLGVLLESGTHTVEFRYTTPFFRAGLLITLLGFLLFAGICLIGRSSGEKKA